MDIREQNRWDKRELRHQSQRQVTGDPSTNKGHVPLHPNIQTSQLSGMLPGSPLRVVLVVGLLSWLVEAQRLNYVMESLFFFFSVLEIEHLKSSW